MRISKIMKPLTKVANVVGPVVSIAEGVSFVYDVATYKKRAQKERRERDATISREVATTYVKTKDAREEFLRNEMREFLKTELPTEVTAQLKYILLEKERREKEKQNGQDSN